MAFNRDFMHANGSGKSNLSNGGNSWTYQGRSGSDNIATIRGNTFFLVFADALEIGDVIFIFASGATTAMGISHITAKTESTVVQSIVAVAA